mgnify:CR=1 FL=1
MAQLRFVLLSTFLLSLLMSCSKKKWPRVKYEVISNTSVDIAYTMVSGGITYETVAGSWSTSFRGRQGNEVFLSAVQSGAVGSTTIKVYFNGNLHFVETASFPGQVITIQETIP